MPKIAIYNLILFVNLRFYQGDKFIFCYEFRFTVQYLIRC